MSGAGPHHRRGPRVARGRPRARPAAALLGALAAGCACAVSSAARAQDVAQQPAQLIDWYYAATFGTGVYRVGDRTVTVVRLPFGTELRPPAEDRWGIRLKLPVTAGLYNLSNAVNDVLARNFATLSAMPGVEFEKEVAPNWVLKPTASAGYAFDVTTGSRSTLFEIGARSQWTHSFERVDFALGNALLYAGNAAQDGLTQKLGLFATGLNFYMPTGGVLLDRASNLGLHFVHYLFFNDVDFLLEREGRRSVNQQYEVALTFGTYRPTQLLGFDIDRIGLGIRLGEDLFAVRLVTGFIF
jgi:hypothetical protein